MEKRHLFERESQQECPAGIRRFGSDQGAGGLGGISPALGTGLWHWRCKQASRASVLGCAGEIELYLMQKASLAKAPISMYTKYLRWFTVDDRIANFLDQQLPIKVI